MANTGFHSVIGVGVGMAMHDLIYRLDPWKAADKKWVDRNTWTMIWPAVITELVWLKFRPESDAREVKYQMGGCIVGAMIGWRI